MNFQITENLKKLTYDIGNLIDLCVVGAYNRIEVEKELDGLVHF